MDIPAGAGSDRVVAQIGPGAPSAVLNTLLNGSKFDYVILGVNGDPGAVQKVILTPRQAANIAAESSPPQNPPPAEADAGDADNGEREYPERPSLPVFRHPPVPVQPSEQSEEQQQNGFAGPGGEAQNGNKTPEQLMQELQQMQQQQQIYQEQLNPANRNPQ